MTEEHDEGYQIEPMEKIDLGGTLAYIWAMYRRQKADEADAGREVKAEIDRMRYTFNLALNNDLDPDYIERQFPEESDWKPGTCPTCNGEGWHYSHKAHLKHHDRTIETQGMVTCDCAQGRIKNGAIKEHGQAKKKRGGRDFS